jgi:hypothetical protein
MELNVREVYWKGMLRHSIAGLGSMFIGNGIALALIENYKTALQLDQNIAVCKIGRN